MAKASVRNLFDLMAGDRMATIMGYLSDVPAGKSVLYNLMAGDRMATIIGYLSDVPAGKNGFFLDLMPGKVGH